MSKIIISLYLSASLFLFHGCGLATTRPKLEMSLAASAFLAAKEVKANVLAPNLFRKAEVYYLKAKSSYRRKYFNKAKQYAVLSQKFSEQAEFVAIRKATLENNPASGDQGDGGGAAPAAAPDAAKAPAAGGPPAGAAEPAPAPAPGGE